MEKNPSIELEELDATSFYMDIKFHEGKISPYKSKNPTSLKLIYSTKAFFGFSDDLLANMLYHEEMGSEVSLVKVYDSSGVLIPSLTVRMHCDQKLTAQNGQKTFLY